MHTISYKFTTDYNENLPNNNYSEETTELTFDGDDYTFRDYLIDNGVNFEQDGNEYIVLDSDDEQTSERYFVVSDTKTCYRINKYPVEIPWKKHITTDMIYNSGYENVIGNYEFSRFDTLEEAQAKFEAEKENCVCDDFKGSAGWLYCTYVLELEEIKIEIDEDGDEEIVDGDFLDYFTIPYDYPEDDEEDEDEDE